MVMDPHLTGFSDYINGFKNGDESVSFNWDQSPDITNTFNFNTPSPDLNFMDFPFLSNPPDPDPNNFISAPSLSPEEDSFPPPTDNNPGGDTSLDDNYFSEAVLKYIGQILMEEDVKEKPCMFHDPFALRDTEKSLYEVLGEKYPPPPNQPPFFVESPDGNISGSSSDNAGSSTNSTTSTGTGNSFEPLLTGDIGEYNYNHSFLQTPLSGDYSFQPNSQFSLNLEPQNRMNNVGDGMVDANDLLVQNFFSNGESVLQFRRGVEEASKFLPSNSQLVIDVESYNFPLGSKGEDSKVVIKKEKGERENSPNGSRGRKNHDREEDVELEQGRNNKQSAVFEEENELSEMFDKVLLCSGGKEPSCLYSESSLKGASNSETFLDGASNHETILNEARKNFQPEGQAQGGNGGKARGKKQGKKKETVDLRALLVLCAQAVSTDDRRTSNELLKQIRQHSSPFGDGSQRLAHFFANGLEARLAGISTGCQIFYASLASKKVPAVEILKTYHVYLSACPFKRIPMTFANQMILKVAAKATKLHIIDFGIQYGFQWPVLIQSLSNRAGGPCKLHITGIEVPQPGFRPAERNEETGRRLAKYCERFNVPFEYNAIASQNWETIQMEDFKIDNDEVLAVNCLNRFENLLDETVELNCPRNAVLKLIRKMNPDIFVQCIANGSYNTPFFVTRFREALFHFSSLFDMCDTNISRESPERLMFERELYGREIMNAIACEGLDRVGRPETYRQWQVRNMRAGLRQHPLDQELIKKFRARMKAWYHKDFVIDVDGNWMLQGWKGRIVYASSYWVPA